jgi:hypothetical protein
MSHDDDRPPCLENGKLNHFQVMDTKFCARMRAAIAQGLESAPIGVVTTPGTKNPKTSNQAGPALLLNRTRTFA